VRITQELLLKLTHNEINKRLRQNPDLVAIYLAGSVLTGDPLLGGSTDIDLVFVHKEDPPVSREVARISYEISLDIVHHHQSLYTYHRQLRLNPWLGPSLSPPASILHDPDPWLSSFNPVSVPSSTVLRMFTAEPNPLLKNPVQSGLTFRI